MSVLCVPIHSTYSWMDGAQLLMKDYNCKSASVNSLLLPKTKIQLEDNTIEIFLIVVLRRQAPPTTNMNFNHSDEHSSGWRQHRFGNVFWF